MSPQFYLAIDLLFCFRWGRQDHLSRMITLRNVDVCAVAVTVENGGAPLYEECLL